MAVTQTGPVYNVPVAGQGSGGTNNAIQSLINQYSGQSGNAGSDRGALLNQVSGGQDALTRSIQSAMSSAMPGFFKNLQSLRESNVARGAGTGGLGTTTEGDLMSAFQRNIANAAGSQAMNLYNTQGSLLSGLLGQDNSQNAQYASMLGGQRDYETQQANAAKQRKSGLFGGIGSLLGGIGGSIFGGPAGGALGASIGGGLGSFLG